MEKKEELYKRIRIAGFATFIPFVLISGPIGGYLLGELIKNVFHLNRYTVLIFMLIGSAASFVETFRIIKVMLKIDKRP